MQHPYNLPFQILSLLAFLLLFVPLCLRLRNPFSNVGLSIYMFWVSLACLNAFINSVVWRDNVADSAPTWCDVSIRIILALNLAIPAASLCVQRGLYRLTSKPSGKPAGATDRRALLEDLSIGFGLPLVSVALAHIVQGARYGIFEEVGCYPLILNMAYTIVFFNLPPLLVGLVSAYYGYHNFRILLRRLWSLDAAVQDVELRRMYIRLSVLATFDAAFTVPLSAAIIGLNVSAGLSPWISWADTHSDYDQIMTYTSDLWRSSPMLSFSAEFTRWSAVFCAFLLVAVLIGSAEMRAQRAEVSRALETLVGGLRSPRWKQLDA